MRIYAWTLQVVFWKMFFDKFLKRMTGITGVRCFKIWCPAGAGDERRVRMTSRESMSVRPGGGALSTRQWIPPHGTEVFKDEFYEEFDPDSGASSSLLYGKLRLSPTKSLKEPLLRETLKKLEKAGKLQPDHKTEWDREMKRVSDVAGACDTCEKLMTRIQLNASHHEDEKAVALEKATHRRHATVELRDHLGVCRHGKLAGLLSTKLWFMPPVQVDSDSGSASSSSESESESDSSDADSLTSRRAARNLDVEFKEVSGDDNDEESDDDDSKSVESHWSGVFVAGNIGSAAQVRGLGSCEGGNIVIAKAEVQHAGNLWVMRAPFLSWVFD